MPLNIPPMATKLTNLQMKTYRSIFLLLSISLLTLSGCAGPGASSNIISNDMEVSPLQIAAGQPDKSNGYKLRTPDLKKVKALLVGGADVNKINMWGSALHAASRYGNLEIVTYLIGHGANVNLKGNFGDTPLMYAASVGKFEIVKLLIEKGADVNAENSLTKWAPLTNAALSGRYEIVAYLIDKGADVSKQAGGAYVNAASGMALFMKSETKVKDIFKGHKAFEFIAILELLKSKGASVNSVNTLGQTALHMVAIYGNPEVTRYFLKAGVDPKIEAKFIGTALEATRVTKEATLKLSQSQTNISPAVLNDKDWVAIKKHAQESLSGYDEVIAILTPVTNSAATIPANASIQQVSLTQGISLGGQVQETLVGCAKLKASLYACEKLPWPASTGCSALAKSQFSNSVCN